MKAKKLILDVIFIIISAGVLTALEYYGLLEEYVGFTLIPILIAYYLGQYSNKWIERSGDNKADSN